MEGFYGKPWTHDQRKKALQVFRHFKFNTFLIAPKNDYNQRVNWRELLSFHKKEELRELVEIGNAFQINVSQSVSPGADICYSNKSDLQKLIFRFEQMYELGIRHLFLLWDDIDWNLTWEADKNIFNSIEEAQAYISNAIADRFLDCEITVCPMIYWGRGESNHLIELGNFLSRRINLMWTGRQIRSEYLDSIDASIFEKQSKRKPIYWDNFPVNNLALRNELHFGPIENRAPDLFQYSKGLLANPMLQFNASMIALFTVGEYLYSPENYVPNHSWEKAIDFIFENQVEKAAMRVFLRSSLGSPLNNDWAPDLRKTLNSVFSNITKNKFYEARQLLINFANEIVKSFDIISSDTFSHKEFQKEITPWLPSFKHNSDLLFRLSDLLENEKIDSQDLLTLQQESDQYGYIVYKDVIWEAIQEIYYYLTNA